MATIYASAPGTGSGGSGTDGSPYTGLHDAIHALIAEGAGSELLLKTGTYTPSMSWNTITWGSGSPGAPLTIRPETFTADTTRGVPGGTTSVIWKTASGGALNFGVTGPGYWSIRGIVFDADNYLGNGYISFNYGAHDIEFRNNVFRNTGRLVASTPYAVMIEGANNNASTALLNNAFRYNEFSATGTLPNEVSHWVYWRSSGSVFEYNVWDGTYGGECAIQFFSKNGAGYNINNNIVRFNTFKNFSNFDDNNANVLFSLNCSNNYVYSNLFHDSPTRIAIDLRGGSGINGTADGNVIAYNTIVNCLRGISVGTSVTGFTNTVVKKNIAYGNGSSAADNFVDNEGTTIDSANSFDGTNPQFTEAGSDNYTLSASTPAGLRAESTLVGTPFDDFDITGATRDAAEPSLGAYEYDAADTPEPPINVYANPGGYTIPKGASTILTGLSVTQEADLVVSCWLSLEGTNAIWTDVDTSEGGTSN